MTSVIYGSCPDCGQADTAGATCYSDSGQRVVACSCGSRRPPAPMISGFIAQPRLILLQPGDVVLTGDQVRRLEERGWKL